MYKTNKSLNDFVQGCSNKELLQFSKNLNNLSPKHIQLIVNELSYKSRTRINNITTLDLINHYDIDTFIIPLQKDL